MPNLPEKYGSREVWLRWLYVQAALIWLFRSEYPEYYTGAMESLKPILADAYVVAGKTAHLSPNEVAFGHAMDLVSQLIESRIAFTGGNPELARISRIVEGARACDALQEIFNCLARKTRNAYQKWPRRKTMLDREWLGGHPVGETRHGDFSDRYHINAETYVKSETARIELLVHLENFDPPSLLAVPALLTHELIAHAHSREDRSNQRSYWAEGVMDWVAVRYFELWAEQVGLPIELTRQHGEQLWTGRMTTWREAGRMGAAALAEWLVSEPSVRSMKVARPLTLSFALQMNATDARLCAKDELATALISIRRNPELQGHMRKWLDDRSQLPPLIS